MVPDESALARFKLLFRGRETCFGQYRLTPKKIWTVEKPVEDKQWIKHLDGTGPFLGIVPIMSNNTCWWGAIDIDDDTIDHGAVALKIVEQDLPLITCRSKSGGAHLYTFFREPVLAAELMRKLRAWATTLGFIKNADGRVIETFPKQSSLKPTDTGNWINLPYYGMDETTRYAVDPMGVRLSFLEFLAVAEVKSITRAQLADRVGDNPFTEGPPCLETLHGGMYGPGERNAGLFNVALFFKLAKPDTWQDDTYAYNEIRMDPPMPEAEVKGIVRSIEHAEYRYKCTDIPIQPVCKKPECKRRPYGVLGFQDAEKRALIPVLEGLTKITTDPPTWRLTLNGTPMYLQTEELMNIHLFRIVAMEKATYMFPMLKAFDWEKHVRHLMMTLTVEEAPFDAGHFGQFQVLVSRFLMKRRQADSEDDLLRGLPVQNATVVYFRSQDLGRFLNTQGFKAYDMPQIYNTLKELGAEHKRLRVKGERIQVWSLPIPVDEQDEDFDVVTPRVEF